MDYRLAVYEVEKPAIIRLSAGTPLQERLKKMYLYIQMNSNELNQRIAHFKGVAAQAKDRLQSRLSQIKSLFIQERREFLISEQKEQPKTVLLAFDFDGTLSVMGAATSEDGSEIKQDSIWQMMKLCGFSKDSIAEMADHYREYGSAKDEPKQIEWVEKTIEVYIKEKLTKDQIKAISEKIVLRPEALQLLKNLMNSDPSVKIAIISYGLKEPIEYILEKNGITNVEVFASELMFDENTDIVTGIKDGSIVVGANKGDILDKIRTVNNIDPKFVIAVGDSIAADETMYTNNSEGINIHIEHSGHSEKNHIKNLGELPKNCIVAMCGNGPSFGVVSQTLLRIIKGFPL